MLPARTIDLIQALIPPPDDCSDGELLERYSSSGSGAAFAELVRRHGSMVYGTCRRIANNGADADDAFQATFFVLARKACSIRSTNALRSWLHAVAVKVARKARQQAIKRRMREAAAARPEAVYSSMPVADWWAVVDDELNQLPEVLRQVILACDVGDQSRSKASRELGWPEGTVAKRLARARQELAKRLARRGVTLSVTALSAALAAEATAAVPGVLRAQTISQATAYAVGPDVGSIAVRSLAEGIMPSMKASVVRILSITGLTAVLLAGAGIMLPGVPAKLPEKDIDLIEGAGELRGAKADGIPWKEKAVLETPGWLPGSVAYSSDGMTLVVGGSGGQVTAFDTSTNKPRWTANVGSSFAAVAFAADGKSILAKSKDGVRFLNPETGAPGEAIEEPGALNDERFTAVGVFPDRVVESGRQKLVSHKIIFGTPRGYVVKEWIDSAVPGTITVSTVAKDQKPADPNAVPLAVDPAGTSAIITGPIDRATGKNVLWTHVAGNYNKGSPGNRILEGHKATVVSAAWSKDGRTAVTGDSDGRVIVWDAKAVKETSRVELGQRIAAVAVTSNGKQIAAVAIGKRAEFYVWESAKPANNMKPIHTDAHDYQDSVFACLAFSPDDQQLAGCAIETKWLVRLGELVGQLHIWEPVNPKREEKPPEPTPAADLTWTARKPITHPQFDIRSLAISPDGKKFAVDINNGINTAVFDVSTGTRLFAVSGWGARFIGKDIYTWSGSVNQFDADTGTKKMVSPPIGGLFSIGAQISPNGKTLAGLDCGVLRLIDARTGADAVKLTGPGKPIRDRTRTEPDKQPRNNARTFSTNEVCWSPDGKRLVAVDLDYAVKPIAICGLAVWNAQTGKQMVSRETSVAEPSARNLCFDFSPDGKRLAVGGLTSDKRGASSLALLDATTLKTIRSIPIDSRDGGADVTAVAFSPDGATVAAGVNLHTGKSPLVRILLWNSATGEIIHLLPEHDTPLITELAFTPDGKTLVAATGSILEGPESKETLHRILIWRGEPKKN
ncbi:MAG TPA: sigma-70 family RNA polymerase sigma factor [Gemmataceae bacterium]|jgi:RNA polymerase sigma factor (sigma-70 family)|nr:sigma-70 family RNA polymerase sigma factor [Gemmataceae bacterium]